METRDPLRIKLSRRQLVQGAAAGAGAATTTRLLARTSATAAPLRQATSGELRVGVTQTTFRTDPNRATIGMYPLNTNIFESLVRLSPDYQIEPLLAESWEFVEPNTWRFTLKQGVTFHDGTPFKADAVAWSMTRVALAGGGSIGVDENSTKVIDDYTVEITPSRPNHRLVQQLNHPVYSMVAPNSEPATTRIGTGPYKETSYTVDEQYVVEANDAYWGDEATIEMITFRFIPDGTTRLLALQSGEVDLIYEVPKESAVELSGGDDLQLVTSKVGAYSAFYFNIHGQAPYDIGQDKAVRQAVASAIDKESIVAGVWQGNAEVGKTMIPPAILGSAGSIVADVPFDPEMAKQVLDAAGWVAGDGGIRQKDGRALKLTMIVGFPDADAHKPMPEFVQAQLKDVGIDSEIVLTPDTATYEARLASGEGDLWAEQGSQNDGNPCFLPDLLFYTPDPAGDAESAMYGNAFAPGPAFDTNIDTCRSAVGIEDVQTAAAAAMKVLINDEYVVLPLAGLYRMFGVSKNVQGFVAHPSGVNQRWAGIAVTN